MKFTLSWLKDHLDTDEPLDKLADRLTMIGLEVESVDDKAGLKPFVIAKVLSAEKHPDADKLRVLMVDTGSGDPVQVVCGAPNARAGLVGAFAAPGTYVPGIDVTLAVGNIRGVESHGMMCSTKELEAGEDHDGIADLARQEATTAGVLRRYAALVAGWMAESKFRDGCPIATTLLETAAEKSRTAEAGRSAFESWTDVLREKLVQEGIVQSRAETLARLAIISLEGALIIARVEADATPVISAMDEVAAMMEREAVR